MMMIKIMMITILTNLGVCALWSPTEPSRVGATDFEKLETSNASSSCSTGATSDQISYRGGFWTLFDEQDKKSKSIFNPATLKTQNASLCKKTPAATLTTRKRIVRQKNAFSSHPGCATIVINSHNARTLLTIFWLASARTGPSIYFWCYICTVFP